MIARVLVLSSLLLPVPAAAQSLAGSWAMEMDGTTIFRFDISQDAKGEWHGTWSKPHSFASDGDHFRQLSGPATHVPSANGLALPNDTVELTFDDPRPGAIPDIFDFRLIDPDAARMTYVGTKLAPYTLERVKPDAPLGPWDAKRTYGREVAAAGEPDKPPEKSANEAPPSPEKAADEASAPPEKAAEEAPPPAPIDFRLPPGAPAGR